MVKKFGKSGTVRPYVVFTKDEYVKISIRALECDLEKGQFLHDAIMYIINNKIDIRDK